MHLLPRSGLGFPEHSYTHTCVGERQAPLQHAPTGQEVVPSAPLQGATHPWAGSQAVLPAGQVIAVPVHAPFTHLSFWVQALPSSHAVNCATAVPAHTPPVHTSFWVHGLPSLHAVPSATVAHPVEGLQVPAVWH